MYVSLHVQSIGALLEILSCVGNNDSWTGDTQEMISNKVITHRPSAASYKLTILVHFSAVSVFKKIISKSCRQKNNSVLSKQNTNKYFSDLNTNK